MQSKLRVIKDFDKLDKELQNKVKQAYPSGFEDFLVLYTDPKTLTERYALPFETEDKFYMIRMDNLIESQFISEVEDEDFTLKGEADDLLGLTDIEKIEKPDDLKLEEECDEDEESDEVAKPEFDEDEDEDEDKE